MEKLLIRAREAERTVVGCIFGHFGGRPHADAYRACAALCSADDFLDGHAKALWRVYGAIVEAGLPFAPSVIAPRLAEALGASLVSAYGTLNDLTAEMYMNQRAEEFARIVRAEAIRRKLIQGAAECQENAENASLPVGDVVEAVQAYAADGAQLVADSMPPVSWDSPAMLAKYLAGEERGNEKEISTNWRSIQRNGGLLPGELVVVVARPKVGKSALLQNLFCDALSQPLRNRDYRSGLCLSLEMPEDQWWERWMQIVTAQPREWVRANIRKGKTPDDVYLDRLCSFKALEIARPNRPTVGVIEGLGEAHRRKYGRIDILGIDHMDFVEPSGTPRDSQADRIRETYRDLKLLAGRLDCAVVVLHQGSREGGDGTAPPSATSARGSAGPEEVADLMLGAWRPGMESEDPSAQQEMYLKAIVARRSPPFTTRLRFDPETLVITDEEG